MEPFTIDKMMEALQKGNWGINISEGNHFYKAIFKLEKQDKLSKADVNLLCGSCKRWVDQTRKLIEEAQDHGSREDLKACEYGERLIQDVLEHMHKILSTMPCTEEENLVQYLSTIANEMN